MKRTNKKEISRLITILGVPRELLLVSTIFAMLILNFGNLFMNSSIAMILALVIFFLCLSILMLIIKEDIDMVKIFLIRLKIGYSYKKKKKKNYYVS